MKHRLALMLMLMACALPALADGVDTPQAVADAITELDVERARGMLTKQAGESLSLTFERARLAVYVGDCDTADAILSAPSFTETKEGAALGELAKTCARATAASVVVDDAANGVWIRLQDEADRPLVPLLVDVVTQARSAMRRDLGVDLPRPLRIDWVRDLFSLSAVSGLPVTAAETTGTVAVARWGRVTMLSPRAMPLGYPWQDTLAHEITHLALSRASRDRAPLWLQEGIAKREETRWRPPRPFDEGGSADAVAHAALLGGRSVGIDRLGPSIAMLPSPEAATVAFAEVTSFMSYWIEQNGEPALRLLLTDLKGIGGDDAAMKSVTGYTLETWIQRWKLHLLETRGRKQQKAAKPRVASRARALPGEEVDLTRRVRLGDLLYSCGHSAAAVDQLAPLVDAAPREAAIRWRAARALLAADRGKEAKRRLGNLDDVGSAHGPWYGLRGRFLSEADDVREAETSYRLGLALDPLSEDVACEGRTRAPAPPGAPRAADPPLPSRAERRGLCEAARKAAEARQFARE